MKLIFVLFMLRLLKAYAFYEKCEYVELLDAVKLEEVRNSKSDELWLVQFFNGSDKSMEKISETYETAAKSMSGYAKLAAVNIQKDPLITFVMKLNQFPIHVFYGYYKHAAETQNSLNTIDRFHDETAKQLSYIFEERSIYRYVDTVYNYELGLTDVDYKVNRSLGSWGVIFYDPKCEKCLDFATIWKDLVLEFNSKIKMGSVNNPSFKVLPEDEHEYPIIKYYPRGNKEVNLPITYSGELNYSDIKEFFLEKIKTPKVKQIISPAIAQSCLKRRFCIHISLPNIKTCDSNCRSKALKLLKSSAKQYKQRSWVWLWNEFDEQPELQHVFSIKSAKHPAITVLNVHTATYMKVDLEGDINQEAIDNLAKNIMENIGFTDSITIRDFPNVKKFKPWSPDAVKEEL